MRLQGLALCLLVACGGSSKHAEAPVTEPATTTAPGGGEPAEGAATAPEPVEAAKAPEMPEAAAPAPMATDTKAAPTPKTRGAQKKPKSEDPDARRRVSAARLAAAVALVACAADAEAEVGDPFDNETMAYQIGGGVLCSTIGAATLAGAGGLIAYAVTSRNDKDIAAAVTGMGALTGGEIGLIYGVRRFGDEHEGTGSTGATVVGGLLGLAGGAALIYFGSEAKMPPPAIAILTTTSVIAGPLIGYHLSSEKTTEPVTLMLPLLAMPF